MPVDTTKSAFLKDVFVIGKFFHLKKIGLDSINGKGVRNRAGIFRALSFQSPCDQAEQPFDPHYGRVFS